MSQFHNVHAWGDEEKELQQVQQKFVNYFKEGSKVLDIGSGRGVFLEMLSDEKLNSDRVSKGKKYLKEYTVDKMAKSTIKAYKRLYERQHING